MPPDMGANGDSDGVSSVNDPWIVAAIHCYRTERVSLARLARILGIGEKSFSKIVRGAV